MPATAFGSLSWQQRHNIGRPNWAEIHHNQVSGATMSPTNYVPAVGHSESVGQLHHPRNLYCSPYNHVPRGAHAESPISVSTNWPKEEFPRTLFSTFNKRTRGDQSIENGPNTTASDLPFPRYHATLSINA